MTLDFEKTGSRGIEAYESAHWEYFVAEIYAISTKPLFIFQLRDISAFRYL